MTPDQYCQQKAVRNGSSFHYALLFLSPPRRRAATALMALGREVADVVDECSDPGIARAKLAWWRREIAGMYSGNPSHPVTRAIQPIASSLDVRQEHLLELVGGREMDLDQNRYLDFLSLERYCHRVTGVMSLLSASIFGFREAQTSEYARTLGVACQLCRIIRDIGKDMRMGRIYLPVSELQQFNVTAADILNARHTREFSRLMAFQVDRAERYHDDAIAKLPSVDRKAQQPGLIIAAINRNLLHEIRNDGYRVLTHRTSLTPMHKLWIAWRTRVST